MHLRCNKFTKFTSSLPTVSSRILLSGPGGNSSMFYFLFIYVLFRLCLLDLDHHMTSFCCRFRNISGDIGQSNCQILWCEAPYGWYCSVTWCKFLIWLFSNAKFVCFLVKVVLHFLYVKISTSCWITTSKFVQGPITNEVDCFRESSKPESFFFKQTAASRSQPKKKTSTATSKNYTFRKGLYSSFSYPTLCVLFISLGHLC